MNAWTCFRESVWNRYGNVVFKTEIRIQNDVMMMMWSNSLYFGDNDAKCEWIFCHRTPKSWSFLQKNSLNCGGTHQLLLLDIQFAADLVHCSQYTIILLWLIEINSRRLIAVMTACWKYFSMGWVVNWKCSRLYKVGICCLQQWCIYAVLQHISNGNKIIYITEKTACKCNTANLEVLNAWLFTLGAHESSIIVLAKNH